MNRTHIGNDVYIEVELQNGNDIVFSLTKETEGFLNTVYITQEVYAALCNYIKTEVIMLTLEELLKTVRPPNEEPQK